MNKRKSNLIICLLCGLLVIGLLTLASPEPVQEVIDPYPSTVYTPAQPLTAEQTISAYFEQQYAMYSSLAYIDLSAIINTSRSSGVNILNYSEALTQRRRILHDGEFCYVEREQFPYSIRFIEAEEISDRRISFWQSSELISTESSEDSVLLHFVIEGESGLAYPPIMAVNAEHSVRLSRIDGIWKIDFHYFPGSVRKFLPDNQIPLYVDDVLGYLLVVQFLENTPGPAPAIPDGATPYNAQRAVEYALRHTENSNPVFYDIDDWMGNCANFTSQCINSGFTSAPNPTDGYLGMTTEWYAGSGGGSISWENVEKFYEFATSSKKFGCVTFSAISELRAGDLLQTSSPKPYSNNEDEDSDDNFNHSLIVVDSEKLMLAQNSPDCLVYFSDLVGTQVRAVRPVYLLAD